jgi:hypothetical protein
MLPWTSIASRQQRTGMPTQSSVPARTPYHTRTHAHTHVHLIVGYLGACFRHLLQASHIEVCGTNVLHLALCL